MPELLPENEAVCALLQAGATQLRTGLAGFVGYDYVALKLLAQDWGVPTSPAFWHKVRAVEDAVLGAKKDERQRARRA